MYVDKSVKLLTTLDDAFQRPKNKKPLRNEEAKSYPTSLISQENFLQELAHFQMSGDT